MATTGMAAAAAGGGGGGRGRQPENSDNKETALVVAGGGREAGVRGSSLPCPRAHLPTPHLHTPPFAHHLRWQRARTALWGGRGRQEGEAMPASIPVAVSDGQASPIPPHC